MKYPSFLKLSDYGGYGKRNVTRLKRRFRNIRELVSINYIIY